MRTDKLSNRPLGGDHSFKMWFKIMWSNFYIHSFILFLTLFTLQIFNIDWCISVFEESMESGVLPTIMISVSMFIPIVGLFVVCYKGFYQFWDDLKNGTSR